MTKRTARVLHDDWNAIGRFKDDYVLTSGPDGKMWVTVLNDGVITKRQTRYRLEEVYARLIQEAYERGLAHRALI